MSSMSDSKVSLRSNLQVARSMLLKQDLDSYRTPGNLPSILQAVLHTYLHRTWLMNSRLSEN